MLGYLTTVNGKEYIVTVNGDCVKAQPAKDGKVARGKPRRMSRAQAELQGFVAADYVEPLVPIQAELPLAEPVFDGSAAPAVDELPAVMVDTPEDGLPGEEVKEF